MPRLLLAPPCGQATEHGALKGPSGDVGLALPLEESKARAGRGNRASEWCPEDKTAPLRKAGLAKDRPETPKSARSAVVDNSSTSRPTSGQELSTLGLGSDVEMELRTLQLPVDYREVKQRVMRIWEDLQPQLAVHVGLDSAAKAVVLEQCGKNRGYREADVRGFRPEQGTCLPGGPEVLESRVSMKAVSRRVAVEGVEVAFSRDAGRYVCDYTYYLSLHHGNGCAALIHVPPLSPRLPASLLGKALRAIIQEMLEEGEEAPAPSPGHRNVCLSGSSP